MAVDTQPLPDGAIKAKILYTAVPSSGEELYLYNRVPVPAGKPPTSMKLEPHEAVIHDLRRASPADLSLEKAGFKLVHFTPPAGVNLDSQQQVEAEYWPAVERLVREHVGPAFGVPSRVQVFQTTHRAGRVREDEQDIFARAATTAAVRPPAIFAHCDYTPEGGVKRLQNGLGSAQAEEALQRPCAIVQMWRSFKGRIENSPLALCDARSVAEKDLIPLKTIDNFGTSYTAFNVAHNPEHRWYCARGLREDEALLFVSWHSRGDLPIVPHVAFHDPGTAPDAPDRHSIEARAFVFW